MGVGSVYFHIWGCVLIAALARGEIYGSSLHIVIKCQWWIGWLCGPKSECMWSFLSFGVYFLSPRNTLNSIAKMPSLKLNISNYNHPDCDKPSPPQTFSPNFQTMICLSQTIICLSQTSLKLLFQEPPFPSRIVDPISKLFFGLIKLISGNLYLRLRSVDAPSVASKHAHA